MQGRAVTMVQGAGEQPITLLPAPIRALPYMKGISWGKLGTPEQTVAKTEMSRMLQVYERFCAFHQPLRFKDGRTIWKVCFPSPSRWKSGPERPSAFEALLDNYVLNNRFAGYGPLGQATDDALRSLDQVLDNALRRDQQHSKDVLGEAAAVAAHSNKKKIIC